MSKILVTGAGGFIGSHLVEKLVQDGNDVRAFIRYNSRNFWGWLEDSPYLNNMEIMTGNICEYDSVYTAMQDVDIVYHLAALIGIPYSYISPLAYIRTNIEGTYNILQSARERNIKNILITSTSETYGTAQYVPINEDHPLVGQSPYSATKIGADHLALSFYRSFDLPVKIVRPFNTYGPRQSARAIIPTIIIQILNQQNTINVGNVSPTRDLTFVKVTVDGFIAIAEADKLIGEVTNIGMNSEISIGDLINMIAKCMETEIDVNITEERIRPENSEVERLYCDNSKITTISNWKANYTIESGLQETIEWFKKNQQYYKPSLYNL